MITPEISVVVCTRNRPDSLARTLDSLSAQARGDFEAVVVDQSADRRTRRIVEELAGRDRRFRYLHLDTPGLSRAYNVGIRATTAPMLAFTDDDCVAPAGWLDSVLAAFAANPEVLLLYGQVLLPPELGAVGEKGGATPTLRIPVRRVLGPDRPLRLYGMGANFAARRRVFDLVGPFDEVLGGGGPLESSQDFDFVYRVLRSGHHTLLEPSVTVYHYGFRSTVEWPATMRSYGIGVGGFLVKHLRMGDACAVRLLTTWLVLAAGRAVVEAVAPRRRGTQGVFARGMVRGIHRSLAFPIDRRFRVYRTC